MTVVEGAKNRTMKTLQGRIAIELKTANNWPPLPSPHPFNPLILALILILRANPHSELLEQANIIEIIHSVLYAPIDAVK